MDSPERIYLHPERGCSNKRVSEDDTEYVRADLLAAERDRADKAEDDCFDETMLKAKVLIRAANAEEQLAEKDRKIQALKGSILDHENDCACLPEDQSVTETVNQLREEIQALRAVMRLCIEPLGKLAALEQLNGSQKRAKRYVALQDQCRAVPEPLAVVDGTVSVVGNTTKHHQFSAACDLLEGEYVAVIMSLSSEATQQAQDIAHDHSKPKGLTP